MVKVCATYRKVAGSIPDGVIGIFHWHTPSDRTMALRSTQPLTEMSTRRISGGKCGRCVRLTTLPSSCAVVMKSGNLNFLGPSRPATGLLYLYPTYQEMCGKFALWPCTSWKRSCFVDVRTRLCLIRFTLQWIYPERKNCRAVLGIRVNRNNPGSDLCRSACSQSP